jgi:hypothetical protein
MAKKPRNIYSRFPVLRYPTHFFDNLLAFQHRTVYSKIKCPVGLEQERFKNPNCCRESARGLEKLDGDVVRPFEKATRAFTPFRGAAVKGMPVAFRSLQAASMSTTCRAL